MKQRKSASVSAQKAKPPQTQLRVRADRPAGGKNPHTSSALPGIMETLRNEHEHMLALLDTFEQQAGRLKPGKVPDYHLLRDIMDYLRLLPDRFHHPREDILFAALLDHDEHFHARLQRLQREHETLRVYSDGLFSTLNAIVDGRRVDRPELLRGITRYITGYRMHIEYESREIFPLAKGRLTKTELARISAQTKTIDDPLFGIEIKDRYRRIGRNLRARIDRLGATVAGAELTLVATTLGRITHLLATSRRVSDVLVDGCKQALREQRDTIRSHVASGSAAQAIQLPLALLRNHARQLQTAARKVRRLIASRASEAGSQSVLQAGKAMRMQASR